MQRRNFVKTTGLSLLALTLFNNRSLAELLGDPAYNIKMLTPTTGIFSEKGGTILFHINPKGIVVVDAQFPDTAPHLVMEIKKMSNRPFALLINTHHHGDHTAGNIVFKGVVEHTVAHTNSAANQRSVAVKSKTEDKQFYPDITFSDSWKKKLKKEKFKLHYFGAAHTNGDILVHLEKANIVHVGDLVFNRRHPFIDKSAGADIASWIGVLNKTVSKFTGATFVCGHARTGFGVVVTSTDILAFRDYLTNLLALVSSDLKAGKSKEDILKNSTIPGSPEWQGDGIERGLSAAYEELAEKK